MAVVGFAKLDGGASAVFVCVVVLAILLKFCCRFRLSRFNCFWCRFL